MIDINQMKMPVTNTLFQYERPRRMYIYENKFPKIWIKEKKSLLPVSDRWMSFGRLVSTPGSTREMSLSVRSRDSRLGNPSTRSDVTARK